MTARVKARWLGGAGLALVLALSGLAMLASPRPALAHAAYESSTPEFGEVLDAAPAAIELRFTQELFRREGANTITLTGAEGEALPLGEAVVQNDDRRRLTAAVSGALPPGRYLVSWTNLSADDGDDDAGSYPFYVGREPTADEVSADRALAQELLIRYPGDVAETPDGGAPDAPAPPTPLTTDSTTEGGGMAASVIALGVVGLAAGAGVVGIRVGKRR
jgi:methionine-rich copper-binding protein CopC